MRADSRPRRIPVHPVDAQVALDYHDKFVRDHPQRRFAHRFPRTVVLGQCVVEGDLLIAQTRFLAACARRPNVLGMLDQFFEHLSRGEGIGVVAGNCCLQAFRKYLGLHHIALGLGAHVAVKTEQGSRPWGRPLRHGPLAF